MRDDRSDSCVLLFLCFHVCLCFTDTRYRGMLADTYRYVWSRRRNVREAEVTNASERTDGNRETGKDEERE